VAQRHQANVLKALLRTGDIGRSPWQLSAVAAVAIAAAACKDTASSQPAGSAGNPVQASFAATWTLRDSVVPEQTAQSPIVRISGIERDAAGRMLLGDVSEGTVRLFAANGRLIRTYGRKGRGPGEFEAPRLPRFGVNGRVFVGDVSLRRLIVFDSLGQPQRTVALTALGDLSGFVIRSSNSWIFATKQGADPNVLVETDSLGVVRRSFLPIGKTLPRGQGEHAVWEAVRAFSLAVNSDTAVVVCTVSDSVWFVDLKSGATSAQRLGVPHYVAPSVPSATGRTIAWLQKWIRTFHTAAAVYVVDGAVVVPFVKGVLNYGDSAIVMQRTRGGRWLTFETTTPLVYGAPGGLLGLARPQGDSLTINVYQIVRP
jgi:hypothetical protein